MQNRGRVTHEHECPAPCFNINMNIQTLSNTLTDRKETVYIFGKMFYIFRLLAGKIQMKWSINQ